MRASRSHSATRINTVVTANLLPAPEASKKMSVVGKVKDRLLMAVVLIALVALTGGWGLRFRMGRAEAHQAHLRYRRSRTGRSTRTAPGK